MNRVIERFKDICKPLWPEEMTDVVLGSDRRDRMIHVAALVACTSLNDELVPQGEVLQKLKDSMANEGFTEPPRWFSCHHDWFVDFVVL